MSRRYLSQKKDQASILFYDRKEHILTLCCCLHRCDIDESQQCTTCKQYGWECTFNDVSLGEYGTLLCVCVCTKSFCYNDRQLKKGAHQKGK